jgi:hypothetical protein
MSDPGSSGKEIRKEKARRREEMEKGYVIVFVRTQDRNGLTK